MKKDQEIWCSIGAPLLIPEIEQPLNFPMKGVCLMLKKVRMSLGAPHPIC